MIWGSSPASVMISPDDFEDPVTENEDQCIVDGEHYVVRGHIGKQIILEPSEYSSSVE